MRTLWQDIHYGLRQLRKSPGFTVVTVLTLALGIGATTAIFSIVNGVLLRPLAYPESDSLVYLNEVIPALADKFPVLPVCARHFMEWKKRSSSFENLSLIDPGLMNLTGRGEPERLEAAQVSANLFETLRVQPSLGRTFNAEGEIEGQHLVAVISDGLWRRKFNADPNALGAILTLDNEAYTIIGVLPRGFRFPNPNPLKVSDLAISTQPDIFTLKVFTASERNELMGMFNFPVIGRLRDGVTLKAATTELDVIAAQLVKMSGEQLELHATVEPLKDMIVRDSRRGLLVVLCAVGSVLLIACLNLAILHLVRAERRSFDSTVRMALGASRAQLLRQALMETLLLTVLGTTLGGMVAWMGLGALIKITPVDIPRLDQVRIDVNVLFFALLLTGVTTVLCGLLPALRLTSSGAEHMLRVGGRTATISAGSLRLRNILVAVEVSLGTILLIMAGLLLNSFVRVMCTNKGFHAPSVLAIDIAPSGAKYGTWERQRDFHDRLVAHLESAPGILSAAIVNALPLQGQTWLDGAYLPGDSRPDIERPTANVRFISPDYFRTMGIPLLSGRTFNETDRTRRVAVISECLARILWPDRDALGQQFARHENDLFEVVGVVKDVCAEVDHRPIAMVYRPYWDRAPAETTVVARAAGNPFSIIGSVRVAIRGVDPDLPISKMYTMREVLDASVSQRRFQMSLASVFAACALLLAGLGIYGVVSYVVAQRTREMGIRLAFGARPLDIYHIVLRRGMMPVVLGLVAGVAGACALGRLLQSLLYGVKPSDPLTIVVVVMIMSLVAFMACFIPARHAAKIDPMEALRYE